MAAANVNLKMEQGAQFYRRLTFSENSVPVDLTGWSFSAQMRETLPSTAIAATFTTTILDQVTNTGEMTLTLTAAETSAIVLNAVSTGTNRKVSKYVYDLEATKPDGSVDRILQGSVELSPEVTR